MSAGRVFLAGFLGAIAMFAWTAVSHMATPLGTAGFKLIPNENSVISAMQGSMGDQRGLYLFPSAGIPLDAPHSEQQAAMQKYQAILDKTPSGILIYKPAGEKALSPSQLIYEFGFEFFEALMLAVLLSLTTLRTFGSRLGFALIVGLIAAVTTNLSYWNWYGFPATYTYAQLFVEATKYVLAGSVIALLMGKAKARAATA